MKKFTKILALTLVLIMSVAMFASCAAPNKDPEKAKEALEDNDYQVIFMDDADILGMMADGLEAYIVAADEKEENGVVIYYFKDAESADKAWEEIEKEVEEAKKEDDSIISKKSGKMIYFGNKEAIKAAK